MNFANALDAAARNHPDALAVADGARELTYAELREEADAFAGALTALGVDAGERLGLYLPGCVTFVAAYIGGMKRGAIPVPLDLRVDLHGIDALLERVGATTVVTTERLDSLAAAIEADTVERTIVDGGEHGHTYGDLVADADSWGEPVARRDEHLAEIVFTRGTTAEPRGVLHTHGNLWANARGVGRYWRLSRHTVGLTVCPPFHVFGLHATVTPLLLAGGTNHFPAGWDPSVLGLFDERNPILTVVVPTMLADLLDHGTEDDLGGLERVVIAGGPLPRDTRDEATALFDATLSTMYGTTETMPATALGDVGPDDEPERVGRPARELVALRIEDPRDGTAVRNGERGELLWRGDAVSPGYWDAPDANDDLFVERDGEYWLRSGDLGRLDADGGLVVEGRAADALFADDGILARDDIEAELYDLDGVLEAAVVTRSTVPTVVVKREGDSPTAAAIETRCREASDDRWTPDGIEFADALPRVAVRGMNSRTGGDWFDRTDEGWPEPDA